MKMVDAEIAASVCARCLTHLCLFQHVHPSASPDLGDSLCFDYPIALLDCSLAEPLLNY